MRNLIFADDINIDLKNWCIDFVEECFDTFCEDGVSSPVHGYELVIDTGDHTPIRVKQLHYGLYETPIIHQAKQIGL